MQGLIESLYSLKTLAINNQWIDISIAAGNLADSLEEVGFEDEVEEDYTDESMVNTFGGAIPSHLNRAVERAIGQLKIKIEIAKSDDVPTLLIHTKDFILPEVFKKIQARVMDALPETNYIELSEESDFLLIETHTACVDLYEHCVNLYGIIHKELYGEYDTP